MSESRTKGPRALIDVEDRWSTRMGLVFPGERVVFRGRDLFHDLKDMRWMELFLYGITGRRFDAKQIRLFEGLWTLCAAYPDPRIWNNRVAALAGTARSTGTLGVSAGVALSEASVYGRRPDVRVFDFFSRAEKKLQAGMDLQEIVYGEIKAYRGIPGYARPFVNADERIKPLMRLARGLGYAKGPYVDLAFQVEETLLNGRYRMRMNAAALAAALVADQGLTREEYYRYLIPCFAGGMVPCFIEAHARPEGSFLPLSCHRIAYEGKPRRLWSGPE